MGAGAGEGGEGPEREEEKEEEEEECVVVLEPLGASGVGVTRADDDEAAPSSFSALSGDSV